jgi:hypothetical protein
VSSQYITDALQVIERQGISIGIKPKHDLNKTIDFPGPGAYSPDVKEKKFAFT